MANEIDDAILSAMKAKRRLLDAAIASYEASLRGTDLSPGEMSQELVDGIGSTDVPNGAFNGLTVPAAVKLYLKIVNKKQTTAEIVAGLKKGEMESTAQNFHKLVRASVIRLWRVKREIIKVGEHWALPEIFSPQVRASLSQEPLQKASTKKRPPKKKARKVPVPSQQPKAVPATSQQPQPTPVQAGNEGTPTSRIEALLRSGKEFTIEQVATAAQVPAKVAQMLLGKLVSKKIGEKTATGKYRAASELQSMPVAS